MSSWIVCSAQIRLREVKNKGGVTFSTYFGMETVNFKSGSMRGQFTHNGTHLLNIACNFSSMKELQDSEASITTNCRLGIEETRVKNATEARRKRGPITESLELTSSLFKPIT